MRPLSVGMVGALVLACASAVLGEQTSDGRAKEMVGMWADRVRGSGPVSAVYRHGESTDHSWVLFDPKSGVMVCASPSQVVAITLNGKFLWKPSRTSALREMSEEERKGKRFDALLDPFFSGPLLLALLQDWDKWVVSSSATEQGVEIRARYPAGMRYLACETCEPQTSVATIKYSFSLDGRLTEVERAGDNPRRFESVAGDPLGVLTTSGDYPGAGVLLHKETPTAERIRGLNELEIGKAYVDEVVRPSETATLRVPKSGANGDLVSSDREEIRNRRLGGSIAVAGIIALLVSLVAWFRSRRA